VTFIPNSSLCEAKAVDRSNKLTGLDYLLKDSILANFDSVSVQSEEEEKKNIENYFYKKDQ